MTMSMFTGPVIVAVVVALVLTAGGGLLTEVGPWYRELQKPRLQPPDWLFGPVWTVVLGLAAASFVLSWDQAGSAGRWLLGGLFAANAVLHFLWSPLFFKWKRPDLALIEVPLLWLSILALMIVTAPYSATASWLLLPYLLWVAFAVYLNFAIVRLNGPFRQV